MTKNSSPRRSPQHTSLCYLQLRACLFATRIWGHLKHYRAGHQKDQKACVEGETGEDGGGGVMEGVQFIGEDGISVRTGGRFHFLAFSSQPLDDQDTSNNQKQKFQTPKLDYIFPWYDKGGIERPSTELQRHNLDTKTIYVTVTHHQPVLEVVLSAGAGWVVAIPKATSSVGGALGAELSLPRTTCSTVSHCPAFTYILL